MMILLTIDHKRCRGLYACQCCDESLYHKIESEQDKELLVSDWPGPQIDEIVARCPDKAFIKTVVR